MDIFEKYDRVTVKIECNGNTGSGCLYQPDTFEYSYVFTAKHCLEGKQPNISLFTNYDIKINRSRTPHDNKLIRVLDSYTHPTLDIALLKVEYVSELPNIQLSLPIHNSTVAIYGYPNLIQDQRENKQRINCYINYSPEADNKFELTTKENQSTYYSSVNETIEGLSGSGIFMEHQGDLILVGVFSRLKAPDGAYQSLIGKRLDYYNDISIGEMYKLKFSPLNDYSISNFEAEKTHSPLTFYEDDIKEIIIQFSKIVPNFSGFPPVDGINLEEKNTINKLSKSYFLEMIDKHLHYFPKINTFLMDQINNEYLEMYLATVEELQFKIKANRKKYNTFEEIFCELHDYLLHNLPELRGKRRLIFVFLHFMYYNCDIGEKYVKTS